MCLIKYFKNGTKIFIWRKKYQNSSTNHAFALDLQEFLQLAYTCMDFSHIIHIQIGFRIWISNVYFILRIFFLLPKFQISLCSNAQTLDQFQVFLKEHKFLSFYSIGKSFSWFMLLFFPALWINFYYFLIVPERNTYLF